MIVETTDFRNVISFPQPTSGSIVRKSAAQDPRARQARPDQAVDSPPRRSWRVSSIGDVSLRWVVDSLLIGLAYAAAAHGPVSPDLLHELQEMERRRRRT